MVFTRKEQHFMQKTIKKFYNRKFISGRTKSADMKLYHSHPNRFQQKAVRVAFEEAREKFPDVEAKEEERGY
jgi:hypothetical protein